MPRRSASARSGRCGESGLTLMAVALLHGSISRSRAPATSAPAKFGIRPCGGNGKRATPSAPSRWPIWGKVRLAGRRPENWRALSEPARDFEIGHSGNSTSIRTHQMAETRRYRPFPRRWANREIRPRGGLRFRPGRAGKRRRPLPAAGPVASTVYPR